MSAANGELSIVAYQELGEMGNAQGTATVIHWRWYYHVPTLALWVLILLLLVLVRGNHKFQAWLILLPPLAVAVVWRMIARLLSLPPDMAEPVGDALVSLAAAWAIVWLTGHWFAGRSRTAAYFSALGVMLVVGGLCHFCANGIGTGEDVAIWLMLYGTGAFVLSLATTLSGLCCRGEYRPGRFMAWLLLWTFLASLVSLPLFAAIASVFMVDEIAEPAFVIVAMLLSCVIIGPILGGTVYVLNLPFMLLATRSPFFRERFRQFFQMTQEPFAVPPIRPIVALGDEL